MALANSDEPAKLAGLEILERLGARPPQGSIEQGTSRNRSTQHSWTTPKHKEKFNGLTNRELEILRLIAQGLANAQISQRLFVREPLSTTRLVYLQSLKFTPGQKQLRLRSSRAWLSKISNKSRKR